MMIHVSTKIVKVVIPVILTPASLVGWSKLQRDFLIIRNEITLQ